MFEPRTFGNANRAPIGSYNCEPWRETRSLDGATYRAYYGPPTPRLFEDENPDALSERIADFCADSRWTILAISDIRVLQSYGVGQHEILYATVIYQEKLPNGQTDREQPDRENALESQ